MATIQIIPIEVVIAYVKTRPEVAALVSGQVGSVHRYGLPSGRSPWDDSIPGIVLGSGGGQFDVYKPIQDLRVDCLIYAANYEAAWRVYLALVPHLRNAIRVEVETADDGVGFLHSLLPDTSPSQQTDRDLKKPFLFSILHAKVSEITVS